MACARNGGTRPRGRARGGRAVGAREAPPRANYNPQAELPKRARTSESADEAAPEPEDARPGESAGDEAEPQDDEAAPQREEEDATPFSRGVAIAEIEIMQFVERLRYVHVRNTTLADDIEATIVTTAAQRQAALLPRPPPEKESEGPFAMRRIMVEKAQRERDEFGAAMWRLEKEEMAECHQRMSQFNQLMSNHPSYLIELRGSLGSVPEARCHSRASKN